MYKVPVGRLNQGVAMCELATGYAEKNTGNRATAPAPMIKCIALDVTKHESRKPHCGMLGHIGFLHRCADDRNSSAHQRGVCRMHRNDNFVNVFVLVVFYFSAAQTGVFQFIAQPSGWCWVQCFPVKCNFSAAALYLFATMHPGLQTGKRISRESSSDLVFAEVAQKTLRDCFWCRLVVLWKEIAWKGMKCYSGLRCVAPLNYPVYGPVYRPVHRTVYETHLFLVFSEKKRNTPLKHPFPSKASATPTRHTKETYKGPYNEVTSYSHNPTSLLSLIFPLFTLPPNSRTRVDRRARPCWECFWGLSTVCDLEEGVSPIAGEKHPLQ